MNVQSLASLWYPPCPMQGVIKRRDPRGWRGLGQFLHIIPVLCDPYSPLLIQLKDDTLNFSSTEKQLGHPGFADLRLGLATGPALYVAEEFPELEGIIGWRFGVDGDVEWALALISSSRGVERTHELVRVPAEKAREVLALLPMSEARDPLEV
ncbi:hypothetical protein DFH29DRAFT_871610 [Suillus ampliporus]|nr:hypothetical protein DFH29DRAFT_871610 [Suillus ampliporus]